MDAVLLARIQFALTIGFHYIFPPMTIGVAWMIFMYNTRARKGGDPVFRQLAEFWTKVFAITFAIGVATGITMEFQFGTNWAAYSRFVGDIFGAPLAAEGVFAFFLESSFLGILLYGKRRVSEKVYWISSLMVALGATLSAFWIVVANSWQQTPAGYKIVTEVVNGVEVSRAELTNFMEAVFNPSTLPRYTHVIGGALVVGTFFILGTSAWMLLKKRHEEFAKASLKSAVVPALVSVLLVVGIGHSHAVQVAETQPAKLAAFEGLWETQTNAPLLLFGVPNVEEERTDLAIAVPGFLSILVDGSPDTEVQGLKDFAPEDRPPLLMTFFSFHFMLYLGGWFALVSLLGLFLWWRGKLYDAKLFHWMAALTVPLPFIANELGWIAAEVGRQPWVVQGELRTLNAVSQSVPAGQVLASIIMFSLIYSLLFGLWIYLLKRQFAKGPEAIEAIEGEVA
ncbi:MAG: cytochrome ubiquinol oxidase subunit I [Verrucomicrobiota bacterium]